METGLWGCYELVAKALVRRSLQQVFGKLFNCCIQAICLFARQPYLTSASKEVCTDSATCTTRRLTKKASTSPLTILEGTELPTTSQNYQI